VPTTFTLAEAASQLGVAAITLKRWFLSKRITDVTRDRNGWRVFTEQDIRRISAFAAGTAKAEDPDTAYRVVSLFSGIGGFDLGFDRAGFKTVFQCERDAFCREILRQHWPLIADEQRSSDIREVKGAELPSADVWVAGFPCQDVSLARMGKREGLGGRQSGLFHEFARLLGEGRPRVFVLENVHGLLSSHQGRDFGVVLGALAELGYDVGWRTLNSKDFGVPQSRRRVYIVGCHRDWRGPGSILFEPERGEGHAPAGRSHGPTAVSPFKTVLGDPGSDGPVVQAIAYCLYACSARHTGTDWSRTYVCYPKAGRVRRLTPSECEGVMAFPPRWTVPAADAVGREDVESARYHALGNAVTPPVAHWLAQRVLAYLQGVDAEAKQAAK